MSERVTSGDKYPDPAELGLRKALSLASSLFPLVFLCSFYLFVLHARLLLGYWPSYNHPEPKTVFGVSQGLLLLGLFGFPIVGVTGIVFAVISRIRSRRFPLWLLAFSVVAPLTTFLVVWLDAGDYTGWLID